MLECTLAFLAINQSINQSLGYSLNINHLFSRIFVLGMILISLNLIACSSSGGGGESTPAVDNGDGGDGGGGEPPKKPMTPTDVGGDDETLGESCTPPMSVPQIDSTKDFFYLVKYLGGGTGANAPRTNGAKIVFSAYRKNNTGLVTSDVSFEVIGNPNYTETLTFADSEHFASVVVTIGVNPPSSIVIYPLDGGATYPVGLTSGNPYFTSSTSNCTDANDYFEFNMW